MHVAQFIVAHPSRRHKGGRIALFGVGVVHPLRPMLGFAEQGDVVVAAVGALPLDLEVRSGRHRRRSVQGGRARIVHHRWRRLLDLFHRGEQCVAQVAGTAGGQKNPAGLVGQAAQTQLVLLTDVEPDDMHGEIHSAHGQFGGQLARIDVAGFQPVADQHHRGPLLGVAQGLGRLADSLAQGRLALGADRLHLGLHGGRIVEPHRYEHFDVRAVALAPVAVYGQAGVKIVGNLIDEIGHDRLGDGDLGLALDLAPHGTGAVQHQHHAGRSRIGRSG